MDWIEKLRPAFKDVSLESGYRMGHDTHYDARNFVFSVIRGKEIHRLDFQPMENGTIQITKLTDIFPTLPWLFSFLHNVVPLFPYVAKVSYEVVGVLNPPFEGSGFKNKIQELVKNAL